MRWLLLLLLVTVVWFLAHAAGGARRLMDNHQRGLPPETKATFSIMPGMIVMPIVSMTMAVCGDEFVAPWGYRIIALLHLVWGAYLLGYTVLTITRLRRIYSRV